MAAHFPRVQPRSETGSPTWNVKWHLYSSAHYTKVAICLGTCLRSLVNLLFTFLVAFPLFTLHTLNCVPRHLARRMSTGCSGECQLVVPGGPQRMLGGCLQQAAWLMPQDATLVYFLREAHFQVKDSFRGNGSLDNACCVGSFFISYPGWFVITEASSI